MESTSRRPTTIDDLAALRTPSDPQVSPDGTRIAFTIQTTDLEKNKYQTHLWVVGTESEGDAPRQWTQGVESESQPRWSPDGKWLAFLSGRTDKIGQIYLLPTNGGEAIKTTDLPSGSISHLTWSPDSARIAFTFRPQDDERTEKASDERKKANRSTPPREITRRHYREDGAGWVPQAPYDLHILDVATQTVTQLTQGENGDQESFCWSPTGDEIAVVRNTAPAPDLMPNASEIFVISASVEDALRVPARKLNAPLGPKDSLAWSPDGQRIAYLGHDDPEEVWGVRNVHVWTVGVASDSEESARDLTPDWDVTCGSTLIGDVSGGGASGPVWAKDGQSVLVLASDHGGVELYRIALTLDESADKGNAPLALTQGKHAVVGFTTDAARANLALLIATPTDAGDLFTMPTNESVTRRLTSLNEDLLRILDLPVPIEFAATATDGQAVPCWAILPPSAAATVSGPHPTILYIHGGPHLMYGHSLFHEYQALASAGYIVLFPNPRGSKGYGEAWTGAIRGNWGEPAQADCLACVDYAIGQGWSDPDRLGIAGGSYGGYLTAWMLGHSDRFAAGVAERGVFNLQSMAGTCDFVWRDHDYFRSDTTADPVDYLRNSPLTYANDITTPLLLIHSEGDLRCPIEQAEQLFAALNMRGRDVVFLRYGPEASHGLSRSGPPDLRLDRQRRIHTYFDRYLKASRTGL